MGTLPSVGRTGPVVVPDGPAPDVPVQQPTTPSPPAPSTGGPATPAASGPTTPGGMRPGAASGPTTGRRGMVLGPDLSRWQYWWEHNREPYLRARVPDLDAPLTGSDGFFMGGSAKKAGRSVRRKHVGRLALPELIALLESDRSQPTDVACLHAIARIGGHYRGRDVVDVLRPWVAASVQVVRENAVLALGITRSERAADVLIPVLRDSAEGRRLVKRSSVHERTRAFAAYALGMIARDSARVDFRLRVGEHLAATLAEPRRDAGDVRVATVFGLRVLHDGEVARGDERRVLWLAVESLMSYYTGDFGKTEQALQAHVPPAVAALLGRGTSVEHQRCKQVFAAELTGKSGVPAMVQSAAIALGAMASPAEVERDDAGYSAALLRYATKGSDLQARFFAWIALAQIGGEDNRSQLLRAFPRANNVARPWVALALGVLAHDARKGREDQQPADETIARTLLAALEDNKNDDVRSALALALGLVGHRGALPALRKLLRRYAKRDELAGYVSLGLALLEDRKAADQIREILDQRDHRPELVRRTGVALAMLGDVAGNERVADVLSKTNNASALRGASEALGYQKGVTCGPRMLDELRDRGLSALAQANVAAALGRSADKDWLPWFVMFSLNTKLPRGGADAHRSPNGRLGTGDRRRLPAPRQLPP